MSELPEFWLEVTAGAAIAVIVASVVAIVLAVYMMIVLADLRRNINAISAKIQGISDRVDTVAKQVQEVTTEVGARTTGIVRTVDDIAAGAFEIVEKYAPIALGLAIIFKLRQLFDRR
ncbi:MAG: hypothetical protein IH945_05035 [Armatimonadetes bacterium]|nr:hypothetical protein [Armatimonadota bacterium]